MGPRGPPPMRIPRGPPVHQVGAYRGSRGMNPRYGNGGGMRGGNNNGYRGSGGPPFPRGGVWARGTPNGGMSRPSNTSRGRGGVGGGGGGFSQPPRGGRGGSMPNRSAPYNRPQQVIQIYQNFWMVANECCFNFVDF